MINDPIGKFVVTLHISISIGQRTPETTTTAAAAATAVALHRAQIFMSNALSKRLPHQPKRSHPLKMDCVCVCVLCACACFGSPKMLSQIKYLHFQTIHMHQINYMHA